MPPKRARRDVSRIVMRAAPRNGPRGVPMPPRIANRQKRTERSTEKTYRGSTKPTYCVHRGPHMAVSRHPEREGRVLVLAHRGELVAAARALEVELDEVEQDREAEDEVDPHSLVHDAERPEALAEGYRDALRPRGEAAPAARHDEQHLGERDRGQPEVGAAEPVAEKAEDEAERGGEHGADQQPDPGRHPPPGAEERGRVGAEPEEGGVAERDLAGVAARHVPCRPGRAPQQDQYEPVEEEGVADHDRPEGGRGEEGDGRPRAPHVPITSAPRWPNRPAGRTTRTVMNRRRDITSFHAVPIT